LSNITPENPDYWYNKDKYVIIGFSRCGTTALSRYMHCSHPEIAYEGITDYYIKHYTNHQPVFLLRDPVEKLWSMYNYFLFFKNLSYDDFLNYSNKRDINIGGYDIIGQCDYEKYIEPFRKFNPIVYKLEDMVKLPDYPSDPRGKNTKKVDPQFRTIVLNRLEEKGITYG